MGCGGLGHLDVATNMQTCSVCSGSGKTVDTCTQKTPGGGEKRSYDRLGICPWEAAAKSSANDSYVYSHRRRVLEDEVSTSSIVCSLFLFVLVFMAFHFAVKDQYQPDR